jgi:signal transduction histidine kinase
VAATKIQLADNTYGQVFAADGTVLASTDDRFAQPMLNAARLAQVTTASRFFNVSLPREGKGNQTQEERVLASPVGSGGLVVAVALNRDTVDDAVDRAGKQLLVLGAVVLLVAAVGSWLLARFALRPVDRMRAQAAELEARDAAGGLDVPLSQDEIGRLGATLNALLGRLHSALERERAFVADAGHELRTPLTVLRGELELARKPGRSRDELVETVNIASEETERLIRLAEDLLVLARDDNSADLRWTSFDLAKLLQDASSLAESMARGQSVFLEVRCPQPLIVDGDPDRIRQAVDNVLVNALRYAPPGSSVIVTGSRRDGRAEVEVVDAGPGFSAELLPVAFERFRREDKVRTRGALDEISHPGSGLGLAIVRNVLRSHGGEAQAFNRADGGGARLLLSWPAESASMTGRDE